MGTTGKLNPYNGRGSPTHGISYLVYSIGYLTYIIIWKKCNIKKHPDSLVQKK